MIDLDRKLNNNQNKKIIIKIIILLKFNKNVEDNFKDFESDERVGGTSEVSSFLSSFDSDSW